MPKAPIQHLSLLLCFTLALLAPLHAHARDTYRSFEALLQGEGPSSFQITAVNRPSSLLILAPHAGSIELGTSELARLIAGNKHSLYLFEGSATHPLPSRLHVTSHHFDEPIALEITRESGMAVSIHAMKNRTGLPELCIGGRFSGREAFLERLKALEPGFSAGTCERFRGTHPDNIVNLSRTPGVQLEFASRLVQRILRKPSVLDPLKSLIDDLECALRLERHAEGRP